MTVKKGVENLDYLKWYYPLEIIKMLLNLLFQEVLIERYLVQQLSSKGQWLANLPISNGLPVISPLPKSGAASNPLL